MRLALILVGTVLFASLSGAEDRRYFLSAGLGVSNVSADGSITPPQSSELRVAGYKPDNGAAAALAAGVHLARYVSVQGSYIYNRNGLEFFQFEQQGGELSLSQVRTRSRSRTGLGEFLVYVRPRGNWLRPYLSAGAGVMRLTAPAAVEVGNGAQSIAGPPAIASSAAAFRVGVGIDVVARNGWGFRFSFGQTLRTNPFSESLGISPSRRFATFHNVFGFVKQF